MKIKIDVSDGKNVFFISDFHLFHKNILRFDNRPFESLEEMHLVLITNWNEVVKPNDVVFYLGDLCFGRPELAMPLVKQLNGHIHFVMGNHDDYKEIKSYNRFESINDYVDLILLNGKERYTFSLFHFPIFSWNKIHHGNYHIHGHTHHNLHHGESADYYVNRRVIDVGCNGEDINYTPVSYKEIINQLEDKWQRTNRHTN